MLILYASKVILKILQARLQQYLNQELPDVQTGFRKGLGSWRKQGSSKTSTSVSLTMLKLFTVWVTTNWKILKKMGISDQLTCLCETYMQVKKQQLEPDLEQWTASKLGKKYNKAVYYHPAYLTYMQSTSCEIPSWMNHKLESRLLGEISTTSDMQMLLLLSHFSHVRLCATP